MQFSPAPLSPPPMSDKQDYRDTVFLPKTDFPMKAGLAQKEPAILAHWAETKLYEQLRQARAGRERFILHDGPPYANGDIHIGHALNHILKDMVVRTQTLLGKDAPYVPGWDCHGLPIEFKVSQEMRKAGDTTADAVTIRSTRAFSKVRTSVHRTAATSCGRVATFVGSLSSSSIDGTAWR